MKRTPDPELSILKIKKIQPPSGRIICVSDIHSAYDEFKRLLELVAYNPSIDTLVLLGDFWLRGSQPRATLEYVMELAKNPNVHVLLGNWDPVYEPIDAGIARHIAKIPYEPAGSDGEAFLKSLPHIIDAGDYVFCHAGIRRDMPLEAQEVSFVQPYLARNDAFMETAPEVGDEAPWLITGHWPTKNYTHEICCCNPIVNREKRVIAIDGGMTIAHAGQLNAFIIERGEFSYAHTDSLPTRKVVAPQAKSGGKLATAWLDRHIERIENRGEFSLCRHMATGRTLEIANDGIYTENEGLSVALGTDYYLPLEIGDTVSVISEYSDRIFAKHGGVIGWVSRDRLQW